MVFRFAFLSSLDLLITNANAVGDARGAGSARVFLMQQRAPARVGRQGVFARDLAAWLRSSGVSRVLVLSGLDATMRKDRQLVGPAVRYDNRQGSYRQPRLNTAQ